VLAQAPSCAGSTRRSGAIRVVAAALILLASFHATSADAHTRSQSFSTWQVAADGDVRLSFSVALREVTRLAPVAGERLALESLMATHLGGHLAVFAGETSCSPVGRPRPLAARAEYVRVEWRFDCPPGADLEIHAGIFFDVAPSHLHFARVSLDDAPATEYLFTETLRRHAVAVADGDTPVGSSNALTFGSYVALGIEHILAGLDHVAFLLALLLLSRRVREVALLVTGFTLGHSLTLSLAVLGVVEPRSDVIEALIGFSIALVAAEAIGVASGAGSRIGVAGAVALLALASLSIWLGVGPPALVLGGLALFTFCYLSLASQRELAMRLSPLLTAIFGLVHGFGFASVLAEIGLPGDRLVPALFGFNVGVEIGQLAIVALLFPAGAMAARALRPAGLRVGFELVSAALCGLGLFWFVARAYGG